MKKLSHFIPADPSESLKHRLLQSRTCIHHVRVSCLLPDSVITHFHMEQSLDSDLRDDTYSLFGVSADFKGFQVAVTVMSVNFILPPDTTLACPTVGY